MPDLNPPRPAILETIENNNAINLMRQLTLNFDLRRKALTTEGKLRYEREVRRIANFIKGNALTSTNSYTQYAASELTWVFQLLENGKLDLSKPPYEKTVISIKPLEHV